MNIKIIKPDQTELVICDGAEFTGQNGKFIPTTGSGKTTLARGMQVIQGAAGRQPLYKPDDGKMAMLFSIGVTAAFASEAEAETFRLFFPASLPVGKCGLVIDRQGGADIIAFDDATIQNLAIEQTGASCTLNYTFRAALE